MQISTENEYLYGHHPIVEVLRSGRRKAFELFLDEATVADRFKPLLQEAQRLNLPVRFVNKQDLFNLCGSKQHQGVVLLAAAYPYAELDDAVFEQPRLLLLDNIEDPRNAGAIIRSADIFGFNTVFFPLRGGSSVYPSVVKTSAGASEHVNIVRAANSNRYVQRAKDAGYRILALDMKGTVNLADVPARDVRPLMLVIGGEDKRIGQYILNEADTIIRIPQHGHIGSLNASVAAGIALYHFAAKM